MPPINLGNGSDLFSDETDSIVVFGENGNDTITLIGDVNTLDGGNGEDALSVRGRENTLLGGNGEDTLRASHIDLLSESNGGLDANNVLVGNRGSDTFFSEGIFSNEVSGTASDMTGGSGQDQFYLRQSSDIVIHNATAEDTSVRDGHTIEGVFDVIRDYQTGELIDIGTTVEQTVPVNINPTGGIAHQHAVPEDGSYAFVHGDFTAEGVFQVNSAGADLLLLYDNDPANEAFFEYSGSVVLVGVSDEAQVNVGTLV